MSTCYISGMPINTGDRPKKTLDLNIKIDEPTKKELVAIGLQEDRPVGYVARELMLRGLAAYQKDGQLKEHHRATKSDPDMVDAEVVQGISPRKSKQGNAA